MRFVANTASLALTRHRRVNKWVNEYITHSLLESVQEQLSLGYNLYKSDTCLGFFSSKISSRQIH